MPKQLLFKDHAVLFDPSQYQDGNWHNDFVAEAIEECYDFLPDDWYITNIDLQSNNFYVARKKYEHEYNLAPIWEFVIEADPVDDDDDQWVVFSIYLHTSNKLYAFQMP